MHHGWRGGSVLLAPGSAESRSMFQWLPTRPSPAWQTANQLGGGAHRPDDRGLLAVLRTVARRPDDRHAQLPAVTDSVPARNTRGALSQIRKCGTLSRVIRTAVW